MIGIGAVIVIVLGVWLWLNVSMTRGRSQTSTNEPEPGGTTPGDTDAAGDADELSPPEKATVTGVGAHTAVSEVSPTVSVEPVHEVEILTQTGDGKPKVFDRVVHPFRLLEAQVPAFDDERWKRCFYQLTEDDRVLGWAAFDNDTMGASDRDYDAALVDVLRTCHRSMERLRQEVGLSQVNETMIAGDEGRVWMVTVIDDLWLALFLDSTVDFQTIASTVLSSVRTLP